MHIPIAVRVKVLLKKEAPVVGGLDAGVTEVFTPDDGAVFGPSFGVVLGRLSEETMKQGKERNRLHARAKEP